MRAEWKLARAYLGRHWRQFASLSVCAAVFLAAIFSLQMFFLAYNAWSEEQIRQEYGHWDSAWLDVDPDQAQAQLPPADHAGAAFTTGYVQAAHASVQQRPCVGYWTGETQYLINGTLLSGSMPQQPGEAAVAEDACYLLDIPMEPGMQFTVPVTDAAGHTAERTYTLTGVLTAYRSRWSEIVQFQRTEVHDQPNIIVVPTGEPVITAHVLMQDAKPTGNIFGGGDYYVNYVVDPEYRSATGPQVLLWAVSGVLVVLFLLLTVIGIRHAVQLTLQDQRRFITLLRCTGASRRQVLRMITLEGLALALCTAAAGIVIGIALFAATAAVLNQFTYELSYHLHLLPFITTAPKVLFMGDIRDNMDTYINFRLSQWYGKEAILGYHGLLGG